MPFTYITATHVCVHVHVCLFDTIFVLVFFVCCVKKVWPFFWNQPKSAVQTGLLPPNIELKR